MPARGRLKEARKQSRDLYQEAATGSALSGMAVYRPKGSRTFWYDFTWRGRRYRASSGQLRREDAELVESRLKLRLRQEAYGVAPFDAHRTPRFQDRAEIYYREVSTKVTRPERLEDMVRVVLRFWGAKPAVATGRNRAIEGEPYHDLHLGDPIVDPDWIVQFESWINPRDHLS